MTKRSQNNCPDWSSDGPETREGNFLVSYAATCHTMEASARCEIVNSTKCCLWHATMFASQVPLDYYAGNYRQVDPSRPCLQMDVAVAGIRGESYHNVAREMELLFDRFRQQVSVLEVHWPGISPQVRTKRLAIILGTLVGRFIQIHPFINGNGRCSRLLWTWGLIRFGVPPQVRIRNHPENPKYNQVMAKAMQGDFSHLAFFILAHMVTKPPALVSPDK